MRTCRFARWSLAAALVACGGRGSNEIELRGLPGGRRTAERLVETAQRADTAFVIRDPETWKWYWANRIETVVPSDRIAAPAVDFEREMLLVASPGLGGWDRDVDITHARVDADSMVVTVRVRSNVPGHCGADSMRSPMAVARVPKSALDVVFRLVSEDLRCGEAR